MSRRAVSPSAMFHSVRAPARRFRRWPVVAALCAALAVSACGAETLAIGATAVAGADVASLGISDKTLVDHAASMVTGEDCSTVRAMNGDWYCKARLPDNTMVATQLYCYRSLGKITCYNEPQPYRQNQQVAPSQHIVGARSQQLVR